MRAIHLITTCFFGFLLMSCSEKISSKTKYVLDIEGLVALWDFNEGTGEERRARGLGDFPLQEMNGKVQRVEEGPFSGFAAHLTDSVYFSLTNKETGKLNIHGENQGVTVMAWVKWDGNTGFVGGMWIEHTEGGKRQYGLFIHLPYYNGEDQVCGHISYTGKPTPPFPYSCDYSASKQVLEKGKWHFVAFTYDGRYIKSYLDGQFEERDPELVKNTSGFEGYPDGLIQSKNPYYFPDGMGNNGSDFTVGAVVLSRGMGNFFEGYIDGLAVFERALTEKEIADIYKVTTDEN
jgi:hypothetical protein